MFSTYMYFREIDGSWFQRYFQAFEFQVSMSSTFGGFDSYISSLMRYRMQSLMNLNFC
ncbi:hypothetical protein HanHA300_Chr01g0006961 [Helianthus annuus]|nr:hypothetical protein HanHA300_Chr01g0006961 [Helianthus annuus]KAJ0625977.1 hypothetical protein HanHA89_Chr01g0007711 [Helianthus annuus]KAJ0817034.1 hypothetical protein HanLR1_Chr00c0474g0753201 [Helianthus annuus]